MAKVYEEGYYPGRVDSWRVDKSEKGNLNVLVKFKLKDQDEPAFGQWYFVEGKCREMSVKALYVMGFRGKKLSDLLQEKALDITKVLSLKIQNDEYKGKTRSKVAFVNEPYEEKVHDASDIKEMESVDLRALMAECANDDPAAKKVATPPQTQETNFTADDIPF